MSKPTLISWERDLKKQIDNRQAVELEAMYDKYCLSVRKRVDFFGNVLSRIRDELETQDLSAISTEKLFAMYAHFSLEPGLTGLQEPYRGYLYGSVVFAF